jgi:hypothetical protein
MIQNFTVKLFCVVADNLNCHGATNELHDTQSAITAQIGFLAS